MYINLINLHRDVSLKGKQLVPFSRGGSDMMSW